MPGKELKSVFRMPVPVKITGRNSTITNSFVNSIIPVFMPTDSEIREALEILEISVDYPRCAYCGDKASEWDHLHPIVKWQRPTGYVSEIANLVPACGKCNQSKSGHDWRSWIRSRAKSCPGARNAPDLEKRIARLEAFENWRKPRRINFEAIVGLEKWEQHWKNHRKLLALMRECQTTAEEIRVIVIRAMQCIRTSV